MATLVIPKTYQTSQVISLTENDLDAIKDSVEQLVNVTKLDSGNIAVGGIGAAQIAPSAITSALISDYSVTRAKLTPLNYAESASSGANGLSVSATINSNGRPLLITMQGTSPTSNCKIHAKSSEFTVTDSVRLQMFRDVTLLRTMGGQINELAFPSTEVSGNPSMMTVVEQPAAGTYTYSVVATYVVGETNGLPGDGSLGPLQYVKLVIVELT